VIARISLPLVAAAVLVFACGPRNGSSGIPLRAAGAEAGSGGIVTDVRVETANDEDAVRFALSVVNDADAGLELTFPDGRTHDFVVLDSTGDAVWRWSETRLFTQGMRSRLLGAGDTLRFAERWEPPAAGPSRYTLVAELRSDSHAVTRRVDFTLP
jgi:beta-galactosidase/beta-glucuronidase